MPQLTGEQARAVREAPSWGEMTPHERRAAERVRRHDAQVSMRAQLDYHERLGEVARLAPSAATPRRSPASRRSRRAPRARGARARSGDDSGGDGEPPAEVSWATREDRARYGRLLELLFAPRAADGLEPQGGAS